MCFSKSESMIRVSIAISSANILKSKGISCPKTRVSTYFL